jgi:hypothetical protein
MPATTPTGYPYPVGTDRVMDGDNAIRALAEGMPQVQGGSVSIAITAPDSQMTAAVTFPRPFSVVPTVVAGTYTPPASGGNYAQTIWASQVSTTATATVLAVKRGTTSGSPVVVTWIAYAPPVTP